MTGEKYGFIMVVLAVAAGLIGGVVSSQFFTGEALFAEEKVERVVGIQG